MARLSAYYVVTILIIACGSIPKGYDEGGFAAVAGLDSFVDDFGLRRGRTGGSWTSNLTSRRTLVTSLGVLGAAVGAMMAMGVIDRIGRLRTWQLFTVVWMTGFLTVTLSSGRLALLMVARVWGGVGAGGLTVVAPLYLAEIAPRGSRGLVVSIYMVVLLCSLMLGFLVNYAALKTMAATREQYRVVLAVPQIAMGLTLAASLLIADTPAWLASKRRAAEALEVLARLRGVSAGDAGVVREFDEMQQQQDKRLAMGAASTWSAVKQVASEGSLRRRFGLSLAMQMCAQWSGGNGITYYIADIFGLAGVGTKRSSLIAAGGYGATKLVFTMVFTWCLIDVFGRRRCFMTGLAVQCGAHVYMALYMALWRDASPANKAASDAAVASVFVYAVGWSVGMCTVQYIYGAELMPTRVRGVCYAVNMGVHWLLQLAVVLVTPTMLRRLHVWGAYVLWAAVCAVGLVVLGLWAPETRGVPMERMDELFAGAWYMGWRASVGDGGGGGHDDGGGGARTRPKADSKQGQIHLCSARDKSA
ncbi:hypothetical protein CDD82_1454 [Ophiocordyceps australis]|uniref:Major facilitator superfamily (MFS) profile domain-containing protein n=1 Tax=Ophiocordyceps australis TaxID=1399860 RepID=A0A2C5ZNA5_9HYPO|nr:hypothetical protein CDD82_1454 [Ophiocordyceps australis]